MTIYFILSLCFGVQTATKDTLNLSNAVNQQRLDSTYINLLDYSSIYIDNTRRLTIEDIKALQMKPYTAADTVNFDANIFKYPIWFKIPIRNNIDSFKTKLTVAVVFGVNFEYYEITGDNILQGAGGSDAPYNKNAVIRNEAFALKVLDSVSGNLYMKLNGQLGKPFLLRLYTTENLRSYLLNAKYEHRKRENFYPAFVAVLLLTGFFFLFRYFQFSESYLLWYGLYLIAMGLFYLPTYERVFEHPIVFQYLWRPLSIQQIFRPLPWLFFCFYLRDILVIKKGQTIYKHYRFMFWSVLFALIATLLILLLRLGFYQPIENKMLIYSHIPLAIFGTFLAWQIFINKDTLHKLIGVGMLLLTLGALTYLTMKILGIANTFLLYEIPILLEIFFLNQAIGLKMKRTNKALVNSQKNLVLAEQNNLNIQKQLNEELQQLVDEKTESIIAKNKELIKEETLKLEAEFNQKIANAELKALKAQMNPHFIFNCLNAIRSLVQKENSEKATEYLADFASFIRKVLSYSEAKQITLEEELELCELYLKMEHLRFKNGFEYEIKIVPNTAVDFITVPPMLLQPLLENAIWHGLLHKEGFRKISILIRQIEEKVICTIDDNGVGRLYSAKLNKTTNRKSMGMKLFLERLEISNKLLHTSYNYEIIDKYNNHESTGTQVKLYFEI